MGVPIGHGVHRGRSWKSTQGGLLAPCRVAQCDGCPVVRDTADADVTTGRHNPNYGPSINDVPEAALLLGTGRTGRSPLRK